MARGKKTGGRQRGSRNRIPRAKLTDVRSMCRAMVDDPEYRARLLARLQSGKIAPAVETLMWHYAYGKPVETIEMTGKDGGAMQHTIKITIVKAA